MAVLLSGVEPSTSAVTAQHTPPVVPALSLIVEAAQATGGDGWNCSVFLQLVLLYSPLCLTEWAWYLHGTTQFDMKF